MIFYFQNKFAQIDSPVDLSKSFFFADPQTKNKFGLYHQCYKPNILKENKGEGTSKIKNDERHFLFYRGYRQRTKLWFCPNAGCP